MLDDVRPKPKNGVVVSVDVLPKVDCVFDCGPAEFSNVEVGFSEGALKANSPPDGGPKAGCVEVVEPDVDCPLPIAPKVEVVGPDAFPTDVGRVEELVDPNVDCWLPVAAVADGIEGKPKECPVPPKDPADIDTSKPRRCRSRSKLDGAGSWRVRCGGCGKSSYSTLRSTSLVQRIACIERELMKGTRSRSLSCWRGRIAKAKRIFGSISRNRRRVCLYRPR